MKNLVICVALLILIIGALLWMQRWPRPSQVPARETSSTSEFIQEEGASAINEIPKEVRGVEVAPSLEPYVQKEAILPIADGSQMVTNQLDAGNEVPINTAEREETVPVAVEERYRFVRIAFDRTKEGMEIADTSAASVEYKGNIAVVTFPFPHQEVRGRPPYPGPDYLARVKIDRRTGNVLEILGAP
ncbi:MAG: hypothetical protein LBN38_01080 [Verrucomicrobiota bacterium]|nr:hypothetical protein [Verrucomicrobiota bacterium]